MTPYNEPEVLKLLQEESTQRKGFEIIVAQYSEQLYWQIRRMVLSHEDANDLLQNKNKKQQQPNRGEVVYLALSYCAE